jgi:hypothetical protein
VEESGAGTGFSTVGNSACGDSSVFTSDGSSVAAAADGEEGTTGGSVGIVCSETSGGRESEGET